MVHLMEANLRSLRLIVLTSHLLTLVRTRKENLILLRAIFHHQATSMMVQWYRQTRMLLNRTFYQLLHLMHKVLLLASVGTTQIKTQFW
jgi:hypothetical protein